MPLDNQDELFCLVDENDQEIGSITRREAHDGSHKIHRAVSILLTNQNGEILLQKRSKHKDTYPGFWTISASGHVTFGQSYDEAANRELEEELGINTPLTFKKKYMVTDPGETEYDCVYVGNLNSDIQINFDKDEISEVKWLSIEQINAMKNELTPSAIRCLYELGYLHY